jgi:hypothetical protein
MRTFRHLVRYLLRSLSEEKKRVIGSIVIWSWSGDTKGQTHDDKIEKAKEKFCTQLFKQNNNLTEKKKENRNDIEPTHL